MKALFDENLSPRLVAAVAALSDRTMPAVVHLRDRFPAGTTDAAWMSALDPDDRWIVVSADLRIRRREKEAAVLQARGLTGFFLDKGWNALGLWHHASQFVRWWPSIVDAAGRARAGEWFVVPNRAVLMALRME